VLTGTNPPCNGAACHGGGGSGLSLPTSNDSQLYTNLTSTVVKDCGNNPVVNPGKPDQSALIEVLSMDCDTTVTRMPRGCTADDNCVPQEYIDAVAQWIANGAQHP
jgi:hypothetical protein